MKCHRALAGQKLCRKKQRNARELGSKQYSYRSHLAWACHSQSLSMMKASWVIANQRMLETCAVRITHCLRSKSGLVQWSQKKSSKLTNTILSCSRHNKQKFMQLIYSCPWMIIWQTGRGWCMHIKCVVRGEVMMRWLLCTKQIRRHSVDRAEMQSKKHSQINHSKTSSLRFIRISFKNIPVALFSKASRKTCSGSLYLEGSEAITAKYYRSM